MNSWRLYRSITTALGVIGVTSCGENTSPTEAVAGAYVATTFTITRSGSSPQDVLAAGGAMAITLTGQGTTTGTLNIPASITGGSALNESMEGTFTRSGNTLTFQQTADTFVQDATWTIGANALTTAYTTADGAIQVTLTRP